MKRQGFTLVEVLVILAIMAALAAILVPTVANQVRRGDAGRVVGDLTNLRSGIEAFLVNVHRYPGDAEDLFSQIVTGDDSDINGAAYSAGLMSKWDGPYIDRPMTDGGTLQTGFGGEIQDDFTKTVYGGGITTEYLTIQINGIAEPEFELIDADIDGTVSSTGGVLRWASDVVSYLAMPIN